MNPLKDDGGFAFPGEHSADFEAVKVVRDTAGIGFHEAQKLLSKHGGMSLRDYFAGQALPAVIQFCDRERWEWAAARAYEIADAMIAARSK